MLQSGDLFETKSSVTLATGSESCIARRVSTNDHLARRVSKAGTDLFSKTNNQKKKISMVAVALTLSLVISQLLVFSFLRFCLFQRPGGRAYDQQLANEAAAQQAPPHADSTTTTPFTPEYTLSITGNVLTSSLDDYQYLVYVAFVLFMTVLLAGLGLELVVWLSFMRHGWSHDMSRKWVLAQFVFPLLGAVCLGLAFSQSFLALLFVVPTLWKFGFPETLLYTFSGLHDTDYSTLSRISDFMAGIGLLLHHSACAMIICLAVVGIIPNNRYTVGVVLPLLCQHWFVLIQYVHFPTYCVIETVIEIIFQSIAWGSLEIFYDIHTVAGMAGGTMVLAHYLYFISGGMALIVDHSKEPNNTAAAEVNKLQRCYDSFRINNNNSSVSPTDDARKVMSELRALDTSYCGEEESETRDEELGGQVKEA